jgi:hypothetical protein
MGKCYNQYLKDVKGCGMVTPELVCVADKTGSGSCHMAVFVICNVEPLDSVIRELS